MNLMRYTVIDKFGGVSFVADAEAAFALAAACSGGPQSLEQLLEGAEPYYCNLKEHVLNGLSIFDEWNVRGHYERIHRAIEFCKPEEQPVFRVVDDLTRETSLRQVKAGVIIFNLPAKRIVQLQNTYILIQRKGRARVFDGTKATGREFIYRLPKEWALVP